MQHRIMKESDIALLLPIYIGYYNTKESGEWTEQTAYKRIHQVWSMENSYCLILEDSDIIVAFALGYFKQYDDLLGYELDEIIVALEYQGKGIGTAFMHMLESDIKEKGASLLQLTAVKDEYHEHFYGKLGYKNVNNFVLKVKML